MNIQDYVTNKNPKFVNAFLQLWDITQESIDPDFECGFSYGMPGYDVSLSLYPKGYLNRKDEAVLFLGLAIQKHFIAIYHMGLYLDSDLKEWFDTEYKKVVPTKLDLGKSCLRLKNPQHIPYPLIRELIQKMSAKEYIILYEKQHR